MAKQKVNIVWFKRDLRLCDHAPLKAAIDDTLPTMLLYCFEPDLMNAPDADIRHWRFVWQSLIDMQQKITQYTIGKIQVAHANAKDVFEWLHTQFEIQHIYSYQETGNRISFDRDIQLFRFFNRYEIKWTEYQTNGIIRRLKNRATWNAQWQTAMEKPTDDIDLSKLNCVSTIFPKQWSTINLLPAIKTINHQFQYGGETEAVKTLQSFIDTRAAWYMKHISKPTESRTGCSRLSPYLAWGNLSIRQVYQASVETMQSGKHKKPIAFFISRLHWHCHFIQKFESLCSIEFSNVNAAFDSIRNDFNRDTYNAWASGKTGYPLIDACMHCLKETGYINFRMRAMLVSFLTHNLWQHWKTGAHHLARYFLDYEPGIHYPQLQMQAGTMGVNTIRTYNPIKQSRDHDPEGLFIKQWIPALRNVPQTFIHEPWKMTDAEQVFYECIIGKNYPTPIIELSETSRKANKKLWDLKKTDHARQENQKILGTLTLRKSEIDIELKTKKTRKNNRKELDLNLKLF